MNFYIGDSLEEIFIEDDNVEIEDELLEFIYKFKNRIPTHMDKIYQIDPYADVIIEKTEVKEIICFCNYVLEEHLLNDYRNKEEGMKILDELICLGENAMFSKKGMISIGD